MREHPIERGLENMPHGQIEQICDLLHGDWSPVGDRLFITEDVLAGKRGTMRCRDTEDAVDRLWPPEALRFKMRQRQ
jgi:hypothetical protein